MPEEAQQTNNDMLIVASVQFFQVLGVFFWKLAHKQILENLWLGPCIQFYKNASLTLMFIDFI